MSSAVEPNYALEVRYTLRAFTRALTTVAASVDLTAAEFRILRTLGEGKGYSQMELAVMTAMDRPYVASLVKKMVSRGLLESRSSQVDRRRVDITMTEEGRRIFDQLSQALNTVNRSAADGIPADDLRTFTAVLHRLRANLERLPSSAGESCLPTSQPAAADPTTISARPLEL